MKQQISNNIFLLTDTAGDSLDVYVMEQIGADWWTGGGITKSAILNEVKGKTLKAINLYISSPGGDVDEALAIKDLLIATKAPITAEVSGLTASAATIIMMAAGTIKMSEDAAILIHNASTYAGGNKEELRKTADTLEMIDGLIANLYVKKSGKDKQLILDQMLKNEYMTPDQAIALGIVDEKVSKIPVSAKAKAAIRMAVQNKTLTLPTGYKLDEENQNPTDMAKINAKDIVLNYLKELKAQGFKLVGIEEEKPEVASKKIVDINALFIKNVEDAIAAEGEGTTEEETQVTNAADYSATVTEPVNTIELADGNVLDLPNGPYEVTADGASSLQTDLASALDGTAQSVTVTFDEAATALSISVTGSDVELATVNGSVKFTTSNADAAEEGADTPENLKKKLAAVQNKIEAEKKKKPAVSDEVKNLQEQLRIKNAELLNIKTSKSGGKVNGKTPKVVDQGEGAEDGIAPGEVGLLNAFQSHTVKKSKG